MDDQICQGVHGNIPAINLARDILSGLSHLHAANLVHRDLKPQNILLSNEDHAVIGDFGSVKRIPDGQSTVPGSGHSLIYCPPESVRTGAYGVSGDLYQVGVIIYQLLGGALPYEDTAWLNSRQLCEYRALTDPVDQQILAANAVKHRIARGRILDLGSLPPWVCVQLRRTISKACCADPANRFQSCSEFLARIAGIRAAIHDWRVEDGCPTRHNGTTYRIVKNLDAESYHVEKRRSSDWRRDNSIPSGAMEDLVKQIEKIDP